MSTSSGNKKTASLLFQTQDEKFSFPTENRQFRFEPKNPYDLVAAEGREALRDLTFPD